MRRDTDDDRPRAKRTKGKGDTVLGMPVWLFITVSGVLAFGLFAGIIVAGATIGRRHPLAVQPRPGDKAQVVAPIDSPLTKDGWAYVATSSTWYDELEKFLRAGDEVGIDNLLRNGRITALPTGTQVLVLETRDYNGRCEVRVASGTLQDRLVHVHMSNLKVDR